MTTQLDNLYWLEWPVALILTMITGIVAFLGYFAWAHSDRRLARKIWGILAGSLYVIVVSWILLKR